MLKKSIPPTDLELKAKAFIKSLPNPELNFIRQAPTNSIKCKVTNAITPSEIWVQMCVHSDDHYQAFQQILSEKYRSQESIGEKWGKNDACVFKQSSTGFFRAKITEKPKNGKIQHSLLGRW